MAELTKLSLITIHIAVFFFNRNFTGKLAQYGISADHREKTGVKAAIIREKGTNGEREMAYSLYLAGFDVFYARLFWRLKKYKKVSLVTCQLAKYRIFAIILMQINLMAITLL